MCSAGGVQTSLWTGCPIRILRAHRSHAAPPERFAGLRVLLRPSAPRHPPRPLSRLYSCMLAPENKDRPGSSARAATAGVATPLRLPRKEVIQPHLPVRLPCYDFTPITDPTLDACLSPSELAQRLQVLPTFVV